MFAIKHHRKNSTRSHRHRALQALGTLNLQPQTLSCLDGAVKTGALSLQEKFDVVNAVGKQPAQKRVDRHSLWGFA